MDDGKIPVFIANGNFDRPDDLVGEASVDIQEDHVVLNIKTTSLFKKFVDMGDLKALSLGAYVQNVEPEKAEEYWAEREKRNESSL